MLALRPPVPLRKIAVVSGSRADYGHLFWLLREIDDDSALELQLIVTGMHLSEAFGRTVTEIEQDGFSITARVELPLNGDRPRDIARASAVALDGLSEVFERLKPDIVVVFGDRFEMLSAATAALLANIPIAHIHGGESTEGLIDEAIRHAVTKMAHLHFPAAEPYAKRIAQMGENPASIYCFGAPGLDHLVRSSLPDRATLSRDLDIGLNSPLFLITFHPVTLDRIASSHGIEALLDALARFPEATIIVTGVNADTYHADIVQRIRHFAGKNADRISVRASLGHKNYLGLLRIADVVIGNSSSGIIEAPMFRVPSVNIGDRQRGRLRAASVIDCGENAENIAKAIDRALDQDFRRYLPLQLSLYGQGGASAKIKTTLRDAILDSILLKRFFNFPAVI